LTLTHFPFPFNSTIAPLAHAVGGFDNIYKLIANTFVGGNKGMVYVDVVKKGFVAIKATKVRYECRKKE